MHAATQRLWETFWKSPEESVQMPFYVMGPHTSASETLSVRRLLDHSILPSHFTFVAMLSVQSIHFCALLCVKLASST